MQIHCKHTRADVYEGLWDVLHVQQGWSNEDPLCGFSQNRKKKQNKKTPKTQYLILWLGVYERVFGALLC